MARNSQFLYADALGAALATASRWLDLGCGHQFVPDWVPAEAIERRARQIYVAGVDADLASLRRHTGLSQRVCADIERLPFADDSFDLVTANMVIEHVVAPDRLFAEVSRVLTPGGRFLVHTPNVHGYTTALARLVPSGIRPRVAGVLQGRRPEDVYPTHYRANSVRELSQLAARSQLSIERLDTVTSSAQLFRVPVAGWAENQWLRLLSRDRLERWRPCIIGLFSQSG